MRLSLALFFALSACDQQVSTDTSPQELEGLVVTVRAGEGQAQVGLGGLALAPLGEEQAVPLIRVLEASQLGLSWESMRYNFVATDGFSAEAHGCDPVGYAEIERGYLYPATANLVWEDGAAVFGCHFVNGVATIEVRALR
ncbi:MAG: hypothetical protein JXX28_02690 [Deltaproteobacteria bacterium]|nr:hypothetical protein [Deltaproteobacteria bacterium]